MINEQAQQVTDWTLRAAILRQVVRHRDRLFLNNLPDGRRLTYAQLGQLSAVLAHEWCADGIGAGSHVALMLDNTPEFVLSIFALSVTGAVLAPVNTASRGKLLAYYLNLADVKAVIVEAKYLDVLTAALAEAPEVRTVIVVGGAAVAPSLAGVAFRRFPDIDALLALKPVAAPASAVGFGDLACLLFTSGTTGPSKANMWTQAGIHYYAAHNASTREIAPDDIDFVCLPLFHANALIHSTLTSFMAGASIALAGKFSASSFWDALVASKATRFNAIGAIADFLWSRDAGPQDRAHCVKVCSLAPVPPYVHGFEERFGVKVFSGYGLTDYGLATAGRLDDPPEKSWSCGRPRDGVSVRVVDENDIDKPAGVPGEIVFRIEQPWGSAIGYYKMPEETLRSRRNLWFHTGDRGYIDADGFLFFTDRLKDAIRRRGENISAYEIESAIASHAAVQQVAAYPVRAELLEDEVAVSIVLKPGATMSEAELISFCTDNMSTYMIPRFVAFVRELPLTANQKVEKYKLQQAAQADLAAIWDARAKNPTSA